MNSHDVLRLVCVQGEKCFSLRMNINNPINISLYPFLPLQVITSQVCLHLGIDYVIPPLTLGSDTAENSSLMQPHTIRSSLLDFFGGLKKYLQYHLAAKGEAATGHTESSWRLWPRSLSEIHFWLYNSAVHPPSPSVHFLSFSTTDLLL